MKFIAISVLLLSATISTFCTIADGNTSPNTSPENSNEIKTLVFNESMPPISDTLRFVDSLVNSSFEHSETHSWLYSDLNSDGKEDFFIVATKYCTNDEIVDDNSICYQSLIYLQKENTFEFFKQNTTAIHCSNCERTMPTVTEIVNGFQIRYYYGSCTKSVVSDIYEYNENTKNWELTRKEEFISKCDSIINGNEVFIEHLPTKTPDDFGHVWF